MWANSTETTDTASKKCEMWNAIRSLSTFQSVIQSGLRVPMLLLLSILYGPLHWESHCAELATINLDSTECQLNHWKQISLTIKLETENQLSPNRTWSTGAYPQLTVQRSLLETIWNVDSSDRETFSGSSGAAEQQRILWLEPPKQGQFGCHCGMNKTHWI